MSASSIFQMTGFLQWPSDRLFPGQSETALLSSTIGQYGAIWLSLTRWNHLPIPFETLNLEQQTSCTWCNFPFSYPTRLQYNFVTLYEKQGCPLE